MIIKCALCMDNGHEHTKYQNYDESPCFQIEMALNPNFNQIGQAFIQQVDLDLHVNISCRIQWSNLTSILMTYKTIHRSCLFPMLFKSKLFLLCVSIMQLMCPVFQYYAMFDNNATRGELAKLYNAEQVKLDQLWCHLISK